jgi:hypothetical protein
VLVLHDASVPALASLARLADRLAVPDGAHLVDVGLRPAHAMRLGLHAERCPAPAPDDLRRAVDAARLRPSEARWLARGQRAEVAAMRPDRLLRALRRLLLGQPPPDRARVLPARDAGFV